MTHHHYDVSVRWPGNHCTGTSGHRDCDRAHVVESDGLPRLPGSSDPAFRGEPDRWNPEQLLVAALSQCLWHLHLCALAGVVVARHFDHAGGTIKEEPDGAGPFTSVLQRPHVESADSTMADTADALHDEAYAKWCVAHSVNFRVRHETTISVADNVAG